MKRDYHLILSQCQKLVSITIKSAPSLEPSSRWSEYPGSVDLIKDVFFENLILPINHPNNPAPALEVFDCRNEGNFSDSAVLKFIKAKQSRTDLTSLKRISIAFTRPMEIDILEDDEVAQWVSNGLVVDLDYTIRVNPKIPFLFITHAGIREIDSHFG
jgi:hypothetical protein